MGGRLQQQQQQQQRGNELLRQRARDGQRQPDDLHHRQPSCATVSSSIADKATVSGGYNPTGTVTFALYNNPNASGTPLFTDTESLSGGTATSKGYTVMAAGTDYWVATYNGNSNNVSVTSGASSEPVTITCGKSVCGGQCGSTCFWNGRSGQGLICQFNGGSSCTSLGNWLATCFPHLYGAHCDSSNRYEADLAGKTNAQVASFFSTLGNASGSYGAYAQVMATALSAYATNSSLAGGNYAQSCGFTMSSSGSGGSTYNVGWNGSALGLTNNISYALSSLIAATDQLASQGTSNLNAQLNGINTIFNGINTAGGIR